MRMNHIPDREERQSGRDYGLGPLVFLMVNPVGYALKRSSSVVRVIPACHQPLCFEPYLIFLRGLG